MRGASASVGPPSGFPSGRELPSLGSRGNGMSISSLLGGPTAASREAPSASQYASPISTSSAPGPSFPGTTHPSPRMGSVGQEYPPFRRPQTPEHPRQYEPVNRDHRSNSAGSPPGVGNYGTPDGRGRFSTPQNYSRPGPPGMPGGEEPRREPIRVPNPNSALPPRPNSQPTTQAPPNRHAANHRMPGQNENILGERRVENIPRPAEHMNRGPEPAYARASFEERGNSAYAYAERERQEREAIIQRERERARDEEIHRARERSERERDREMERERDRERDRERERDRDMEMERERQRRGRALSGQGNEIQMDYARQLAAQRSAQPGYNRPPEPREQPPWTRPDYEPPRPAYEPIPPQPERPPPQQGQPPGYGYPASGAPKYGGHHAYAHPEPRYPPTSQPQQMAAQHGPPSNQYEASMMERQRLANVAQHLHQQVQNGQPAYAGPTQNGPYQPQESPTRRSMDESQQMQQQRSFLGVEFNRKGRISPLPQAVQGAQAQLGGPGGEPGIKSEFGRMFSGIGSGVSGLGVPSPVSANSLSMPFSNPGQLRREDLEGFPGQDSPMDSGHKPRSSSRGGPTSRRRKLKEEDSREDESSTGRRTPSGRGKRAKTHHHHHHQLVPLPIV
jgi:hypothetical protein